MSVRLAETVHRRINLYQLSMATVLAVVVVVVVVVGAAAAVLAMSALR